MQVTQAKEQHLDQWATLRSQLWPDELALHRREIADILADDTQTAFLLQDESHTLHGFIEGKLYQTATTRYGHVEGWYVSPTLRGQGYGQLLLEQLEAWFLHHAIDCYHSDTIEAEYPLSKSAHLKGGYTELFTLTIFIKKPDDNGATILESG